MIILKILVSVVVGAIAAGVLYSVRRQYHQPAHLKTCLKNSEYDEMKSQLRCLFVTQMLTVSAVVVSSFMFLWWSWYRPVEIAIIVSGSLSLWQFTSWLGKLEEVLYDLKKG